MFFRSYLPRAVGIAVTVWAAGQRGAAQEALRNALLTDASARLREQPVVRPAEDVLRIGPATFDVSVGYSIDASDNIRYSHTDREEDLISRPWASVGVSYAVTRNSRLMLGARFGYNDYIKHSDLDTFFVTPDSEVAFDIRVRDGVITVYDRIDYSQDVATLGALSGVAEFRRLQNLAGVRAIWQLDDWMLQGGYGHLNVLGLGEGLEYLDRTDEQLFGRVGHRFYSSGQIGIETSATFSEYTLASQNDSIGVSVGPFVSWRAGEAFRISVRGGLAYTTFQSTNSVVDDSELASYYAGLDFDHHLTRHITHGLTATHDIRPGVNPNSDFIESTHVNYHMTWAFYRYARATFVLFGEVSEDHRADQSTSVVNESYKHGGASTELFYQLTQRFSLLARYAFTIRDSDQESRKYRENRVTLGASYRF